MNAMKIYDDIGTLFSLSFDFSRTTFSKDNKIKSTGLKGYVLYKKITIKCFH